MVRCRCLLAWLQERASVEQEHVLPYLQGTGGPPEMFDIQTRAARFLRDTQAELLALQQVQCKARLH